MDTPRLPPELLPVDGRFGSGPSKVRPEALAALAGTGARLLGTSHRQPPVRSLVARTRAGLRALWDLPEGHRVALGNGGSTLFWDVVAASLVERRSAHGVFGEFGAKFAGAVTRAPHLDEPLVTEAPPGQVAVAPAAQGVDLYALVANETSTGAAGPLRRPAGADPCSLVVADATSAAGSIRWDPTEVDAYYFAPQKGFGSEGGLWLAVLSPAALERAGRIRAGAAGVRRWLPDSLDLLAALEQSELDQTVNTPAIATLFLLADQLEWLLGQGGMAFSVQRCARSAAALYGWAERSEFAAPFVARPEDRSPVVGTVDFDPAVDAAAVAAALRANGVVDTEPYRKLGRNQLRIGMFPAVDPADVEALTACIDWLVERLA